VTRATGVERRQILVRLPPTVVTAIEAAAQQGYRSRNEEIRMRLESTLWDEHGRILPPARASATENARGGQQ
jgi:hypothetical protein